MSVTLYGLRFISGLLQMTDEERTRLHDGLIRREIPAKRLLDCLRSPAVGQWLGLHDQHTGKKSTGELWPLFYESMADCELFLLFDLLGLLCTSGAGGDLIGKERFGERETNLFILFQYCLTEEQQRDVLYQLRAGA